MKYIIIHATTALCPKNPLIHPRPFNSLLAALGQTSKFSIRRSNIHQHILACPYVLMHSVILIYLMLFSRPLSSCNINKPLIANSRSPQMPELTLLNCVKNLSHFAISRASLAATKCLDLFNYQVIA